MTQYKPSPRPNYHEPTPLPYAGTARHLWGDAEAGQVADWIYVSSAQIHQIVWGLAPGGSFRHSAEFRTIFGADLIYYVLSGTMVIANPEYGEVQRVLPGEAAFFRRDTWHHAFNYGTDPLRVLEFFAPPPSQGTSGAYARTKPLLADSSYTNDQALGRWPMERTAIEQTQTITVVRDQDLLWRFEGGQLLVGLLCSTEHLTVGKLLLPPGQRSGRLCHPGDKSLYLTQGTLHLFCPDKPDAPTWFELHEHDGFFLPAGSCHEFHNLTGQPVECLFGVAPTYR